MKYLRSFESINNDETLDGCVVNGIFFLVGFREVRFVKLTEEESTKLNNVIQNINEKYKDDILVELVGTWLHGPFAPKYGVWIPGYIFQVPCKTKEVAMCISEDLVNGLKKISKGQICITISEGTVKPNKEDPFMSDGPAYHKSGRYIDDPNNCVDMIRSGEEIRIV